MKVSEKIISAILTLVLGILFIVLKGQVVSIAMTILGVLLIVLGIMNLTTKLVAPGVVKIVVGALVILFGWVLVSAALYILAALLLIFGILQLYAQIKLNTKGARIIDTIFAYALPIICIVIAFFLFFNQGGTVDWVFIVAGVFTIIEGILMLANSLRKNEK